MKYSNTDLNVITKNDNSLICKAIHKWQSMSVEHQVEIMEEVENFDRHEMKQRACINYVAECVVQNTLVINNGEIATVVDENDYYYMVELREREKVKRPKGWCYRSKIILKNSV